MVVIKKRDNVIPVDFGEFKLEFVANDKNIHKMEKLGQSCLTKRRLTRSTHSLMSLQWTQWPTYLRQSLESSQNGRNVTTQTLSKSI